MSIYNSYLLLAVCLLLFSFTARSLTRSPLQRDDTATTLRHFTTTICGGVRYDADDGESLKKIVAPVLLPANAKRTPTVGATLAAPTAEASE